MLPWPRLIINLKLRKIFKSKFHSKKKICILITFRITVFDLTYWQYNDIVIREENETFTLDFVYTRIKEVKGVLSFRNDCEPGPCLTIYVHS